MQTERTLPFKKQTKYVVERKIDGDKTYLWQRDGEVVFEEDNSVDKRVASVIDDKDFLLEGYIVDEVFYASDVLYYDERDLRSEEWPERYKILKNKFRWNSAVRMNRPLVVTDESEMKHAIELFNMLDYSEGVLVTDYDSVYTEGKTFIPRDEEGFLSNG